MVTWEERTARDCNTFGDAVHAIGKRLEEDVSLRENQRAFVTRFLLFRLATMLHGIATHLRQGRTPDVGL